VRITEVKCHVKGGAHRYDCELALRRPQLVVVLYRHWRRRSAGGFSIPRGSRTYGFFWRRRPYVLYRIEQPSGTLIAHRYDIVSDVRLGEREVYYLDLLVDIWFAPDGTALIEDEDEVADYAKRGLLSRAQVRAIAGAKALVLRRHAAVAREAERLIDAL
jgi:hypothetical protein